MNPLVSIIMPVYNGEKYLREAIDSILHQTYTNFEFLIVNDGSIDKSEEIIQSYTDPRIKYLKNQKNIGLDMTLNNTFMIAKGDYIARMDCDDLSHHMRLEKQVSFLETHIDYDLVGSQYINIDQNRVPYEIGAQLLNDDEIRYAIQSVNCFCHGSVLFRASFLKNNSIFYKHEFSPYEDYELWTRITQLTKTCNLPHVLYAYMSNPSGMYLTQYKEMIEGPKRLQKILKSKMELPTVNLTLIRNLFEGSKKYRIKTIKIGDKELPSNFMLAYQTYIYKLGLVFLKRKKPEGIIFLLISFYLNPINWFKKAMGIV
jgi:glycosyltransferase involved in cell wall biosynthesis